MNKHSPEEYAKGAGPGGRIPIPMGQRFKGAATGKIVSVDEHICSRTGRVKAYRFEILTTEGKTLFVRSNRKVGDMIQKGHSYAFNYVVNKKKGGGYCFSGKPTPLNPSTDPSLDRKIR